MNKLVHIQSTGENTAKIFIDGVELNGAVVEYNVFKDLSLFHRVSFTIRAEKVTIDADWLKFQDDNP